MEINEGLPILNYIEQFMNSNEFDYFSDLKDDLLLGYNFMKNHIQLMINNEEIKNIDITLPKKCLYILGNTVLDQGFNENISLFISNMIELISNWNNNLTKNTDISLLCRLIFLLLEINKSLEKTITTLRVACERSRMLKEWMPPAFEMSKEYLNVLLEKAEQL
jgi:hypothetical protein